MKEFNKEGYKNFVDPNNVMRQLFDVTCSLCGYDEVSFVAENTPETLGSVAKNALDKNPSISDEEMNDLVDELIDEWQRVDDFNSENIVPTFLCFDCYDQLSNGEATVSEILAGGE